MTTVTPAEAGFVIVCSILLAGFDEILTLTWLLLLAREFSRTFDFSRAIFVTLTPLFIRFVNDEFGFSVSSDW